MAIHRLRRRRGRQPSFPAVVVATMLAAFAVAYWWPHLASTLPTQKWAAVVEPGQASYGETDAGAGTLSTSSPLPGGRRFSCQVSSVTDGDTFRCADGERVRLHAVAARETDETCSGGHPCPSASGASATAELGRLVRGGALSCQAVGRSYDRVTAICWTAAGVEVNCAMVRSGTTVIWDRFNRQVPICRT